MTRHVIEDCNGSCVGYLRKCTTEQRSKTNTETKDLKERAAVRTRGDKTVFGRTERAYQEQNIRNRVRARSGRVRSRRTERGYQTKIISQRTS